MMTHLLCDAHFWTLEQQTVIADDNIGCFTYHLRNDLGASSHVYNKEKLRYTEGRDVTWRPRNKQPIKLKQSLIYLEELLTTRKCISLSWLSQRVLQMYFNNGAVVTCTVSPFTGDVDRLHIDTSLTSKLSAENASAVYLSADYAIIAYPDRQKLDYIYFLKSATVGKKIDKFSSLNPRVVPVDIPGPSNRRVERKFAANMEQNLVLCWWSFDPEDIVVWSPISHDRDKANLFLLSVGSFQAEVISYIKTGGDLISVKFSEINLQQIHTVEQTMIAEHDFNICICLYECDRKLQRINAVSISLHANVTSADHSVMEDKLVLSCSDGTLVIYDSYRKLTQSTKCDMIPLYVLWHPSGCLVMAISSRAEVQVFDLALSLIKVQLLSEDLQPASNLLLSTFLKSSSTLTQSLWQPASTTTEEKLLECNFLCALVFDKGPVTMMSFYFGVMSQGHLSPLHFVNQYIRTRLLTEAIDVLSTMNWNLDSKTSYACLSAILNHLLKSPLNSKTEGQIQETLGLFYSPPQPLSEATILRYRNPVSHLARRFFHLLLRFRRFEKSFLLAVDIGAKDLFMDIYFLAKDRKETVLANVAKEKADLIEIDSLSKGLIEQLSGSDVSLNSLDDHYNSAEQLNDQNSQDEDRGDQEVDDLIKNEFIVNSQSPKKLNLDVRFQPLNKHLSNKNREQQECSQQNYRDAVMRSLENRLTSALRDEFTYSFSHSD